MFFDSRNAQITFVEKPQLKITSFKMLYIYVTAIV